MEKNRRIKKSLTLTGKCSTDLKQKPTGQDVTQNVWPLRNRKPSSWQPPAKAVLVQKTKQLSEGKRVREHGNTSLAQHSGREQVNGKSAGERGSVYERGSRKACYHNATHLLNFRFESARDAHVERYSGAQWRQLRSRRGVERSTHHHQAGSRYYRPRHVQEQFLQARCQFVVREEAGAAAAVHYADPDALVDWSSSGSSSPSIDGTTGGLVIEQVWLHEDDAAAASCPICLQPPTAARLTRCGHVYCWSCILHYLALSDSRSRRCPICEQSVRADQLRSCRLLPRQLAAPGQLLEFRLMRRERLSLVVQPADAAGRWQEYVKLGDPEERHRGAKLILASPDQVLTSIVVPERQELQRQLLELAGEPEACFVEQALQLLAEREVEVEEWRRVQLQRPKRPAGAAGGCAEDTGEQGGAVKGAAGGSSSCSGAAADSDSTTGQDVTLITSGGDDTLLYESAFDDQLYEDATEAPSDGSHDGVGVGGLSVAVRQRTSSETSTSDVTAADLEVCLTAGGDRQDGRQQMDLPCYFYQAENGAPIYLHALNSRMLLEQHGSWQRCPAKLQAVALDVDTVTMTAPLRHRLRNLQHVPLTAQLQVVQVQLQPPTVCDRVLAMFRDQIKKREQRRRDKLRRERQLQRRGQQLQDSRCRRQAEAELLAGPPPPAERPPTPPSPLAEETEGVEDTGPSFAQLLRAGGGAASGARGGAWGQAPVRPRGERGPQIEVEVEEGAAPSYSDVWSADLAAALESLDKSAGAGGSGSGADGGKKKGRKRRGRVVLSSGLPF